MLHAALALRHAHTPRGAHAALAVPACAGAVGDVRSAASPVKAGRYRLRLVGRNTCASRGERPAPPVPAGLPFAPHAVRPATSPPRCPQTRTGTLKLHHLKTACECFLAAQGTCEDRCAGEASLHTCPPCWAACHPSVRSTLTGGPAQRLRVHAAGVHRQLARRQAAGWLRTDILPAYSEPPFKADLDAAPPSSTCSLRSAVPTSGASRPPSLPAQT